MKSSPSPTWDPCFSHQILNPLQSFQVNIRTRKTSNYLPVCLYYAMEFGEETVEAATALTVLVNSITQHYNLVS